MSGTQFSFEWQQHQQIDIAADGVTKQDADNTDMCQKFVFIAMPQYKTKYLCSNKRVRCTLPRVP